MKSWRFIINRRFRNASIAVNWGTIDIHVLQSEPCDWHDHRLLVEMIFLKQVAGSDNREHVREHYSLLWSPDGVDGNRMQLVRIYRYCLEHGIYYWMTLLLLDDASWR